MTLSAEGPSRFPRKTLDYPNGSYLYQKSVTIICTIRVYIYRLIYIISNFQQLWRNFLCPQHHHPHPHDQYARGVVVSCKGARSQLICSSCLALRCLIFGYRKDTRIATKKGVKSAGRVDLSVRRKGWVESRGVQTRQSNCLKLRFWYLPKRV